MEHSRLLDRLSRIKLRYRAVQEITENMCGFATVEELADGVQSRKALLAEIEDEHRGLARERAQIGSAWRGPVADLTADIEKLIRAIAALDLRVQGQLRERMASIRRELANLGTSSKAALSYARQTTGVAAYR